MKTRLAFLLIALLTWAQGVWATDVATESELRSAVTDGANIKLTADIALSNYLGIDNGKTVTLDLNGHTLSRSLSAADDDGHVIWIRTDGTLTVKDSSGNNSGKLTGGWAQNGGGINVSTNSTLYFQGGTITGCKGARTGGAICNKGTCYFEGGVIDNCWSMDCGGIYNNEGCTLTISGGEIKNCSSGGGGGGVVNYGTATISGGTFTGNHCVTRGGGVWNGQSATLTMTGGTITGNRAELYGGGVFSYSSFSMSGNPVIKDNTVKVNTQNLYLLNGVVINVTDTFTEGASVGVTRQGYVTGVITSGFGTYNSNNSCFYADYGSVVIENNEVKYIVDATYYVARDWNEKNHQVIDPIAFADATPLEAALAGKEGNVSLSGWYSVYSNLDKADIRLHSSGDLCIILCDGARLKLNSIIVEGDNQLHIYGQIDETGVFVSAPDAGSPGIGASDNNGGRVFIHGGHINATGAAMCSGIGGGYVQNGLSTISYNLNSITIYGGTINAQAGNTDFALVDNAAGIGGAGGNDNVRAYLSCCGTITIYGGSITATGGNDGAGIGTGERAYGGNITIWGGNITATGVDSGAGIGGGEEGNAYSINIYGGNITATSTGGGAGIGTGYDSHQQEVDFPTINIYDGNITAISKGDGAGIGTGEGSNSVEKSSIKIAINGGTIIAKSEGYGAGIGGGQDANGPYITINGGTVNAYGGTDAAGIGCGEEPGSSINNTHGGYITITGGSVNAYGKGYGCGIGAGERAAMGKIIIKGGTIFAAGGEDNGIWAGSIGGHDNTDGVKSLTIAERMKVWDTERSAMHYERYAFCEQRRVIAMAVCDHDGTWGPATFTDKCNGTHDVAGCRYCSVTNEAHTFDSKRQCTRCHYQFEDLTQLSGSGYEADPYLITNESDWNFVADYLNGGHAIDGFSGKYFKMTADIGISKMMGQKDHCFKGNFDGDGHSLTITLGSPDNYLNRECAPFGWLENVTIQNLMIAGSIYSSGDSNGGLATHLIGKNSLIRNCVSRVSINANYSGENLSHSGGFIGLIQTYDEDGNRVKFEGCAFVGEMQGMAKDAFAGFVGWRMDIIHPRLNYIDFTECLVAPEAVNISDNGYNRTFCYDAYREDQVSYNNCYFARAIGVDDGGQQVYASASAAKPVGIGARLKGYGFIIIYEHGMKLGDYFYVTGEAVPEVNIDAYVDNTALFKQYKSQPVNARLTGRTYQAKQKADGTWQAYAYSVCLPFDMNMDDKTDVEVYMLHYIKDNSDFVFVRKAPYLFAGEPYLLVVRKGSVELKADNVQLISNNTEGTKVIPWDNHESPTIGRWRGTLQKIAHDEAASQNAYILQKDGTFKRIKATDNAWVGAFVSAFYPNQLTGCNSYKIKLGEVYPGGGPEEDITTDFPADFFETDCDIDDATGVETITNKREPITDDAWYDLQGRKLQGKPTQKGIYIMNGKKVKK